MSSFPRGDDLPSGIKLLAGIAHDLRTPLARLRLRAELECPEAVSQAMEEDFQAVTHLIDQILGYAQGCIAPVGSGAQAPLLEVVRRGVLQHLGEASGIGLGRLDDCDAMVPQWPVQRVLNNLIANALAHGRGPVQVEVQVVSGGVELLVFDHGPGLSWQQWPRALQPFVQLNGQLPSTRHCGLGLAIVAQIARQLNGHLVLKPFDGRRSGIGLHLPT